MRIARAYLVTGQAEPTPRDPRGGGFDPGDAAAFAAILCAIPPGRPAGPERVRLARRLSCCGR